MASCRSKLDHESSLHKYRRVCATVLNTRNQISCKKYAADLMKALSIDVTKDDPSIHPSYYCLNCYSIVKRLAGRQGVDEETALEVFQWSAHTEKQCCLG